MKRSRSHITALNIFVVVGYSIVPYITGEDVFQNQDSDYPGSQFISEDCAPARRKQIIKVNSVELLCDSQENDDGSRYGDSPSCRAGDDAKAAVSFTVRRMTESFNVYVDVNSRTLGQQQRILNFTNVCNIGNIAYWGDGDADAGDDLYAQSGTSACPLRNGPYSFFVSFTVPSYSQDSDLTFTPDLCIDFYTSDRDLVGCVETGSLARVADSKGRERRGQRLFVVSILLFCLIFFLCLMGHRRKRKQGERAKMKRQASMMRRFHYIQTTRSGEMMLNPTLTPSLSASRSYGSGDSGQRQGTPSPSIPSNIDDAPHIGQMRTI